MSDLLPESASIPAGLGVEDVKGNSSDRRVRHPVLPQSVNGVR